MRNRKLRLAKETLTVLDAADLGSVAGANSHDCWCRYTYCPNCVNDLSFEFCPTPTIPIENCL